jgi:hypothetical protein
MAPPFLIASARSESEERAEFMASKAAEEGKLAVCVALVKLWMVELGGGVKHTVCDGHRVFVCVENPREGVKFRSFSWTL